jgi:hypothetical protein
MALRKVQNLGFREKQAQKKRRRVSADSLSTVAYNKFVTGSQSVIPLQYVTNFKSWGMI